MNILNLNFYGSEQCIAASEEAAKLDNDLKMGVRNTQKT